MLNLKKSPIKKKSPKKLTSRRNTQPNTPTRQGYKVKFMFKKKQEKIPVDTKTLKLRKNYLCKEVRIMDNL
jgi:hypothetical protein